jgi:hypothetical protein
MTRRSEMTMERLRQYRAAERQAQTNLDEDEQGEDEAA